MGHLTWWSPGMVSAPYSVTITGLLYLLWKACRSLVSCRLMSSVWEQSEYHAKYRLIHRMSLYWALRQTNKHSAETNYLKVSESKSKHHWNWITLYYSNIHFQRWCWVMYINKINVFYTVVWTCKCINVYIWC